MNIVSLIPSYRPNKETLPRVVSELEKVSSKLVFFTADGSYDFGHETLRYDPSITQNLVFTPRQWILQHMTDDWDYVLYNEDDILISERSVLNAVRFQDNLPYPYAVGFNRFERLNGEKYWIDQHPDHGVHTGHPGRSIIAKMDGFWVPANFHSGNYLLSKESAERLIKNKRFDSVHGEHGISYCGILESGATSLYRTLLKVLPTEFESVECEHLINKYCFIPPTPKTDDLKRIIHECNSPIL